MIFNCSGSASRPSGANLGSLNPSGVVGLSGGTTPQHREAPTRRRETCPQLTGRRSDYIRMRQKTASPPPV